MRIHEKIKDAIDHTPGLTQKGLAERMGVNPAAVNRMLHGRRNIMAEEIPVIEDYLGIRLTIDPVVIDYPVAPADPIRPRGMAESPAAYVGQKWTDIMVPVYGSKTGAGVKPVLNLIEPEIIDWVMRHPSQQGIRDAFAVYMYTDAMEPRYFTGELIFVHPGRPPELGRDCVIVFKTGEAYVRKYVGQSDSVIRVAQYNPTSEAGIRKDNVQAIYAVVGRG